jgi:hypothetical protein
MQGKKTNVYSYGFDLVTDDLHQPHHPPIPYWVAVTGLLPRIRSRSLPVRVHSPAIEPVPAG